MSVSSGEKIVADGSDVGGVPVPTGVDVNGGCVEVDAVEWGGNRRDEPGFLVTVAELLPTVAAVVLAPCGGISMSITVLSASNRASYTRTKD